MKYFVGIDIGVSGAIAIIKENMEVISILDMPVVVVDKGKTRTGNVKTKREYDEGMLKDIIKVWSPSNTYVMVEKTSPQSPTMGSAQSNYFLGFGFALFKGMLAMANISYEIIAPRVWQKYHFQGLGKDDTKVLSYQVASRLFPNEELRTSRGRIIDGRSDALLIAMYSLIKSKGETVGS